MNENVLDNPFAPPSASLADSPLLTEVRIEGKLLVVPKGWVSPPICLKSGETENLTRRRRVKLQWANPAFALFILVSPIIYLLVYFLVRRGGTIEYYFSETVAARYRKRRAVMWAVFFVGLALAAYGVSNNGLPAVVAGLLVILLTIILAMSLCRPFQARKIKGNSIWIGGIPKNVMERIVSEGNQRDDFATVSSV